MAQSDADWLVKVWVWEDRMEVREEIVGPFNTRADAESWATAHHDRNQYKGWGLCRLYSPSETAREMRP